MEMGASETNVLAKEEGCVCNGLLLGKPGLRHAVRAHQLHVLNHQRDDLNNFVRCAKQWEFAPR